MSLADRLFSKFHSYPRSFASRPTVYFSPDNLLATDIISSDIPAREERSIFTKYIDILMVQSISIMDNKL